MDFIRLEKKLPKLLIVAMLDSVHTYRWLQDLVAEIPANIVLFPSGPHRFVHERILRLEAANPDRLKVYGKNYMWGLFAYSLDLITANLIRGRKLSRVVDSEKPDVIHSLETQHSGYLVSDVLRWRRDTDTVFFLTSWGSDFYWFQNKMLHRRRLKATVGRANYLSAECSRDYALAEHLGFRGVKLSCIPNSFSIDREMTKSVNTPPSSRRKIMVKGYSSWSGQGLRALLAIWFLRHKIQDYEVIVYSASLSVRVLGFIIKLFSNLRLDSFGKFHFSMEAMSSLYEDSVIHLGVSKTDGISTAVLESMSHGCLPVQSSTSCAKEWIEDGKTGVILRDNKLSNIVEGVEKALEMIDSSFEFQEINLETLRKRVSKNMVRNAKRSMTMQAIGDTQGEIKPH